MSAFLLNIFANMMQILNILAILYDASFEKSKTCFSTKYFPHSGARSVVQPILHPIPTIPKF